MNWNDRCDSCGFERVMHQKKDQYSSLLTICDSFVDIPLSHCGAHLTTEDRDGNKIEPTCCACGQPNDLCRGSQKEILIDDAIDQMVKATPKKSKRIRALQ